MAVRRCRTRLLIGVLLGALLLAACSTAPPEAGSDPLVGDPSAGDDASPTSAPAGATDVSTLGGSATGAWAELPPAPIGGRSAHRMVWTGSEVLVWGGFGDEERPDRGLAEVDGARYDPRAGTWTSMAEAPILPDFSQHAVWTGEELLIWGDRGGSAEPTGTAAYDPDSDTWRELPPAPLSRLESTGAAWTGTELLVWGVSTGLDAGARGDVELAAYDPEADTWRSVPQPPLPMPRNGVAGVWAGDRLLLWGGSPESPFREGQGCEPTCNDLSVAYADAAAYDPVRDVWSALPEVPEAVRSGWRPVWTGSAVLVEGAVGLAPAQLHRWDPDAGAAEALADHPDPAGARAQQVWTGRELIQLQEKSGSPGDPTPVRVWALDPEQDRWSALPDVEPDATRDLGMVWAGEVLVLWGGSRWPDGFSGGIAPTRSNGFAFDPTAPAVPVAEVAPDWDVEVAAEVEGIPLRVHVGEAEPLTIGGEARVEVAVEAERDVWVRVPEEGQGPGILTSGGGRLALVGPDASYGEDPARPELGLQVWNAGLVRPGFLPAGRALPHPLQVLAEEVPFAPVAGTYVAEWPLTWWEAVPPPRPYPSAPDGKGVVRLTVTLTAVSDAGADDRSDQEAARQALARPACDRDDLRLDSGDGTLAVEVDGFGWFGQRSYGARALEIDGEGVPVAESLLFVNGRTLRECIHPTFSFDATRVDDRPGGVIHTATVDGLDVTITQQAVGGDAPQLVHTYTFTNPGPTSIPLRLTRLLAVVGSAGDAADDGSSLVLRTAAGSLVLDGNLDGRSAPDRFAVARGAWLSTSAVYDSEPLPNGGIPASGLADAAGNTEVGAAQEWLTEVGSGATVTLTSRLTHAR
jgi:hypothetical protein